MAFVSLFPSIASMNVFAFTPGLLHGEEVQQREID